MKKRSTVGASSRGSRTEGDRGKALVRARSVDLHELSDGTDWERVGALSDDEIRRAMAKDPDAAPELDEAFWRNAQILDPRHGKTTITMRVDEDVLAYFKGRGPGYQSRMNAVLRAYVYARRERSG
jgi:uncharacterized protein (DUF4415 family)